VLQDLLAATLEIPFSVPPYMSLLARSVATLEGIALMGDPNYQMVAQAYPFVVRKVLRNNSSSSTAVLREILYDADGQIQSTRLSTLLNAALGYVADVQGGFIDFDSVPEDGATLQDTVAFLLSAVRVRTCQPQLGACLGCHHALCMLSVLFAVALTWLRSYSQ
jgi:aarF domain-containing kinase